MGPIEIDWDLDAACQARGEVDSHPGVNELETAGGSVRLTYSLRR